ncbi:MAG: response regulator [Capsulimonadaceae bacterium]
MKVLVVEDNEMNRDMLARRLARRGYIVSVAVDGEQGLEMAHSDQPDLVLMDLTLPGIDGWEATRLLRADRRTANLAIIALTAHAMANDRDRALQMGCDDYDVKPVEIERLIAKIESALVKRARK